MMTTILSSAILGRDVPYLDRVEMLCEPAADWLFPIEKVRIGLNGTLIPKTQCEVSSKSRIGQLVIVNKTTRRWLTGNELSAEIP